MFPFLVNISLGGFLCIIPPPHRIEAQSESYNFPDILEAHPVQNDQKLRSSISHRKFFSLNVCAPPPSACYWWLCTPLVIQEIMELTASVKIKDDIFVKEQISIYMANVKNVPHFGICWTTYGIQLRDLISVLKYYSCLQCNSVPCESSFSVSSCINRKQHCSLSSPAIRYSI
jgi:hypothetical protein